MNDDQPIYCYKMIKGYSDYKWWYICFKRIKLSITHIIDSAKEILNKL